LGLSREQLSIAIRKIKTMTENTGEPRKGFSMSRHALAGASIAVVIAACWILLYLKDTIYGFDSLFDIVLGKEHGIGADGAEALFVIAARFIIGFSLSWAPITAVIAALRRD
jgi:hypothetical protein